jgi:hypothetical protein
MKIYLVGQRWRQQSFIRNCSARLNSQSVREVIQQEVRLIFREHEGDGQLVAPDPKLPLLLTPRDVDGGRIENILRRLSGFRYMNGLAFSAGLERTLVAYHQKAGRRFEWKIMPGESPLHVEFIDDVVGFGVFADRTIEAGDVLGEYAGMVSYKTEVPDGTYGYTYPPLNYGTEDILLSIDATHMGNVSRFINHSPDEPIHHDYEFYNGHWHVVFTAQRTIQKGAQLFIDYGSGYWEGKSALPLSLVP